MKPASNTRADKPRKKNAKPRRMKAPPPVDELSRAKRQAIAQLASIREAVHSLTHGKDKDRDAARDRILEDPLSVEVRPDWHLPGSIESHPGEFCILLSWGGPAVRLIGELDELSQPLNARLECQDWFQPWTSVGVTADDETTLLEYARCFYFGG